MPPAVTVTVPPVATSGTPGTDTCVSLGPAVAVWDPLVGSLTVTVAPLSTVKLTLWLPAFASAISLGATLPSAFTSSFTVRAVYPAASAFAPS